MLHQMQTCSWIFKIRKKHESIKYAPFNPQWSLLMGITKASLPGCLELKTP